jgi:hypothetical protein
MRSLLRDVTIMLVVWALVTAVAMVWINFDIPGIWPPWLGPDDDLWSLTR